MPFEVVQVPLPWQHAVSRNECKLLSAAQKSLMVQRPVRVMLCASPPCGPDASGRLQLTPDNVWFVAKDVAQLLHIHEANVARRIADFLPHERARMHVLCMQVNAHTRTRAGGLARQSGPLHREGWAHSFIVPAVALTAVHRSPTAPRPR